MLSNTERNELLSSLRKCQKEAVLKIDEYLTSETSEQRACLVCLPTGAGKSGVIATVCQSLASGPTLVLSPRRAVCDQLLEQVRAGFFSERGLVLTNPNPVIDIGAKVKANSIVIDTFQKLVAMEDSARHSYLQTFKVVIVDEGHSEPAPMWGRIVRSMNCKKIIVTATPYRNDLFQFDIGSFHYGHSFKNAVAEKDILNPIFKALAPDDLYEELTKWLNNNPGLKCIIKCQDFDSVRSIFRDLKNRGLEALAFHDRFATSDDDGGMPHVPKNLKARSERVFVHQHKLDEGVDIPNAKLLVLAYAVSNGRELVQATGRVVRKSSGSPEVWDCSEGSNVVLWNNYRDFDDYISEPESWDIFISSLDSAKIVDAYLSAFPKLSYFGQSFRKTFDIQDFDPDTQLNIPLASICFMHVERGFAQPSFVDTLAWELRSRGELVRVCSCENEMSVIISVTFDNSKFLKDEIFFQPRIEVIVCKQSGSKLALFDSRSVNHSSRKELKTGLPIEVTSLLKLANRDKRTRTRETHARSVSTTQNRAEMVSLRGKDLERMSSTQSNSSYALSIAKVDNFDEEDKRTSSYYLGVGSGRVSDQKKRNFSLSSVCKWIDDVVDVIDSQSDIGTGILSSFSLPINQNSSFEILSITLDLSDLNSPHDFRNGRRQISIAPDFYFETVSNGRLRLGDVELGVIRDPEDGRITFTSDAQWTPLANDPEVGELTEWLNTFPLKALLSNGVSYLDGRYYMVTLPSQPGFDLTSSPIGRAFTQVRELQDPLITEEKGEAQPEGFAPNSLFNLIDQLFLPPADQDSLQLRGMKGDVADSDIVVCTDMGTEAADFIVSSERKLIFIHAKCGSAARPKSSAGAIAEVGGQAIKNLEHLISKNTELRFGNEGVLRTLWPNAGDEHGLDRLRIFKDPNGRPASRAMKNGASAMDRALKTIKERRRSNACEKELWIVVGKSFSLGNFSREVAKGSQAKPESLQALQLVMSWISAAQENDVNIRYFVSP